MRDFGVCHWLLALILVAVVGSSVQGSPTDSRDECLQPQAILRCPEQLPYTLYNQTTCGAGNDFSNTCLGNYDGGEDYILRLDVTQTINVAILLNPKTTTYTGILLDSVCPPGSSCMAMHTSSSASQHGIDMVTLQPGKYYVMVDTWPSPACIPDFNLTVQWWGGESWGDDCNIPLYVPLDSSELPLAGAFTTQGTLNDYQHSCLDIYGQGEDFVFQFGVYEPLTVDFTIDPSGVAGSGMILSRSCPATGDCGTIMFAIDSVGTRYGFRSVSLDTGDYYLTVDSRLPVGQSFLFELLVDYSFTPGDANHDSAVDISDVVYLITYIFQSGTPPQPLGSGDANCDDVVDISDPVFLITYIFCAGNPPIECR